MYRRRKKVVIEETPEKVVFAESNGTSSLFVDPRISGFGFRGYGQDGEDDEAKYTQRRWIWGLGEGRAEMHGLLPFQVNGDFIGAISSDKVRWMIRISL